MNKQRSKIEQQTAVPAVSSSLWDVIINNRLFILWIAAACLWTWHGKVHEIDPVHQRQDLETLMVRAKASVDGYLKDQGTLPTELPDLTLAGLIRYTPIDTTAQPPTYSLEGKLLSAYEYWGNVNGGGVR
jgi:hypothetical protein